MSFLIIKLQEGKSYRVSPNVASNFFEPRPRFTKNLKSDRNRKPISGAKMRFTKSHKVMITSVFERK